MAPPGSVETPEVSRPTPPSAGSPPAHVVHLSTVHRPFDTRIFLRECKSLAAAGFRVTLIVPHHREEVVDGVRLVPLPQPKSWPWRITTTMLRAGRAAWREAADLYHVHDPELLPLAWLLRLRGSLVVYDAHEDLPRDIATKRWIPTALRRPVAWGAELVEHASCRFLSALVAATPTIGRRFPQYKTVVVNNYPVLEDLDPAAAEFAYRDRAPGIVYLGDLTEERGGQELFAALGLLPPSLGARLTILGAFTSPELERFARASPAWSSVDFRGWRGSLEVRHALDTARVGIVLYHALPNYTDAQPRKLYEYMAAGLPVVASDFPAWRQIIADAGCGLTVDPLDPGAVARAITWLLEHPDEAEQMGARGRAAVELRYRWDREATALVALYRRLLEEHR